MNFSAPLSEHSAFDPHQDVCLLKRCIEQAEQDSDDCGSLRDFFQKPHLHVIYAIKQLLGHLSDDQIFLLYDEVFQYYGRGYYITVRFLEHIVSHASQHVDISWHLIQDCVCCFEDTRQPTLERDIVVCSVIRFLDKLSWNQCIDLCDWCTPDTPEFELVFQHTATLAGHDIRKFLAWLEWSIDGINFGWVNGREQYAQKVYQAGCQRFATHPDHLQQIASLYQQTPS